MPKALIFAIYILNTQTKQNSNRYHSIIFNDRKADEKM